MKTQLNSLYFVAVLGLGVSSSALAADCVSGTTYTTAGSYSCSVPTGVTTVSLTLAGGFGGFGANTTSAAGGMGGQGAMCNLTLTTVPGGSINLSIGASGVSAGGSASASGSGVTGTVTAGGGGNGTDAVASTPGVGGVGGSGPGASCVNGSAGLNGLVRAGSASPAIPGAGGYASLSFSPPAPAPVTTAIPTLSEWALIFMASLLAMLGIRRMRRSK